MTLRRRGQAALPASFIQYLDLTCSGLGGGHAAQITAGVLLQARIFNDFALTYQAATVKYRQLIAGIYIHLARFAFAGVFRRKLPAKSTSPSMVAARNGYTLAQRLVAHLNSASNRTGRAATRNHHVF